LTHVHPHGVLLLHNVIEMDIIKKKKKCGAPGVRRGADAVWGEILRAADSGVDALSPVLVSDLGQSVVPLEVT